jgi:hypothetical protein
MCHLLRHGLGPPRAPITSADSSCLHLFRYLFRSLIVLHHMLIEYAQSILLECLELFTYVPVLRFTQAGRIRIRNVMPRSAAMQPFSHTWSHVT